MSGTLFLDICLAVTLMVLALSFVLIVVRIVRGPSLPDRILALDLLVSVAIGFIAAFGIDTGFSIYVDIAISLGLVGFLSTVALARFVLRRGELSLGEEGSLELEGEGDNA
ncbi:cation:proton antiporter [Acuticoccus mangrovi]|uniref:Sodium:proton antiporter n=1 Tax=Acuticoccus mangrovi TaxID=2796142 RepID=A0A934ILF6_9HYPH|nr:cation:proton antiporter [Acuticoccus mangrovi]MBJ3774488.1 sodium:proton antiporter [Acuticoccus mangrovi]